MKGKGASSFDQRSVIGSYAVNAMRNVPGLDDLHRMTMLLLDEAASRDGRIIVIGAGGGMEIAALGQMRPDWDFIGVDTSPEMLTLARETTEAIRRRVELIGGDVESLPQTCADAATCLLVFHHVDKSERRRILKGVHSRLRPGGRFVLVEHAAIGIEPEKWLARSAAFSQHEGIDRVEAAARAAMMRKRLTLLSPDETERLMGDSGFHDVELFYAAFSFRGWVASA